LSGTASSRRDRRLATRDNALALRERVTATVGLGALTLTGAFSLVAAATDPGRSDAQATAQASAPGAADPAAAQPWSQLSPPPRPPQCCADPAPRVVSGGS